MHTVLFGTRKLILIHNVYVYVYVCRSRWPRCLKGGSAAVRSLGMRFRLPPGAWVLICCECCVLLGRGLCDGPITCPEESYRLWCVWVRSWNLNNEEDLAHQGCRSIIYIYIYVCVCVCMCVFVCVCVCIRIICAVTGWEEGSVTCQSRS